MMMMMMMMVGYSSDAAEETAGTGNHITAKIWDWRSPQAVVELES